MSDVPPDQGFDGYAADYDAALQQGLAVSGEDKGFFARGRIAWLARCLKRIGFAPRTALDFGCGTGTSVPLLLELLKVDHVVGVDVSRESLAVARRLHGKLPARFVALADYVPDGSIDLAFCNGVFHHIPLDRRDAAVRFVSAALRPGGLFALWENNPLNPGTRYVMSKIPFDRDAVTLTGGAARRLVRGGGFEALRTDYLFIFPALLKMFRFVEKYVTRLPLGAQYQVLGRKAA